MGRPYGDRRPRAQPERAKIQTVAKALAGVMTSVSLSA